MLIGRRTLKLCLALIVLGAWTGLGGEARSRDAASVSSWFDPAWGYRMKVTASSVMTQGGPFRDFSMVVRLGSAQSFIFDRSRVDGGDLVITKGDGLTPLSREVVVFDPVGLKAEIWFRADTLSLNQREFYVYYGNPMASLPAGDGSAWSSAYLGVYHFDDDPGTGVEVDSGPNGNDVLAGLGAQFTSSDTIQGAVGQAWKFNGTTHWIDGDGLSSSDSSYTITAWFACWNQFRFGDADFAFSAEEGFWHLSAKRNSDQRVPDALVNNGTITWGPSPIDTLLHQYTWCMDGQNDTIRFYYDGVERAPILRYSPSGKRIYTGHQLNGQIGIASPLYGNPFDLMEGIVDEFRVRVGIVSTAWVASEYRNQKSNFFLTFGPEEPFGVVPVQLLSFSASWDDGAAAIDWTVAESQEAGTFRVFRDAPGEDRIPVTGLIASGQSTYRIQDRDAPHSGAVYWLEWTDRTGSSGWLGSSRLDAWTGHALHLAPNNPNPFQAHTSIAFTLDRPGDVRVRVYDLRGREVARPWTGALGPGYHEIPWEGNGIRNEPLPSGVYLLRLETPSGTRTRKMIKAY